mmetsp:Transcript_21025/g.30970  ORF Transcript_21025/g.30970 Transcript_21025/m.30970 type:complete len:89 (+) Transcript_21025:133-399(+)
MDCFSHARRHNSQLAPWSAEKPPFFQKTAVLLRPVAHSLLLTEKESFDPDCGILLHIVLKNKYDEIVGTYRSGAAGKIPKLLCQNSSS